MIDAELKGIRNPQRFIADIKQIIALHLYDEFMRMPNEFRKEYVGKLMQHIKVLRMTADEAQQPVVDEATEYTRNVRTVDEESNGKRRLAVEGPDERMGRLLEFGNSRMAASGIVRHMHPAYEEKIKGLLRDTVSRMRDAGEDAKGTIR